MYRSSLDARDKGGAIVAVVALHAALLFVLLNLSGTIDLGAPQSVMRVFDLSEPPPPPPEPVSEQPAVLKPSHSAGGSASANPKNQASPLVVPPPRITLPVPVAATAAETPAQGVAPTQGAASVAGPATGAGGQGNGIQGAALAPALVWAAATAKRYRHRN